MRNKRNHRKHTGASNMSSKATVLNSYTQGVIVWNTQMLRIVTEVERLQRSGTLDSVDMSVALQLVDMCKQCRYSTDPYDRTDLASANPTLFRSYANRIDMFLLIPTFNHLREGFITAIWTEMCPDKEVRRRMIERALSDPLAEKFSA